MEASAKITFGDHGLGYCWFESGMAVVISFQRFICFSQVVLFSSDAFILIRALSIALGSAPTGGLLK